MARNYTEVKPKPSNYTDAADYNLNSSNVLSTFNGQLGAENLRYGSFDAANMSAGTRSALYDSKPDGSATNTTGTILPTQAYFITQGTIDEYTWDRDLGVGIQILGPPAATFDYSDVTTVGWSKGIVSLSQFMDNAFMRIPTKEGMIKGHGIVDLEYYLGDKQSALGSANYGRNWRFNLYVYVNGRMVATTGSQGAGQRKSFCMNFAIPIGSSPSTEIDLRFSATFDSAQQYVDISSAEVNVFNTQIWVRNCYR